MGQACSCLQHRRKLERRASDESTLHDTDGGEFDPDNDELDILIDGSSNGAGELDGLLGSSSSSSSSSRSSGGGRLRGSERSVFTKRNSKSVRTDTDESERTGSSSSGLTSIATLEAEDQLQSSSSRTNSSSNGRLLGQNSGSALSVEQNLDVLRSYQEATGVVDEGEMDLECVMCLDTFSAVNPKVRTLCNCGMNRTNFHMSCLLEWKNRDAKCPVCREYLYYED